MINPDEERASSHGWTPVLIEGGVGLEEKEHSAEKSPQNPFEVLIAEKIIIEAHWDGQDYEIADFRALDKLDAQEYTRIKKRYSDRGCVMPNTRTEFILEAFVGKKIVSAEDFKDPEKRKPKDFLYFPQTKAEAFDEEAIRQADFYKMPYEILNGADQTIGIMQGYCKEEFDLREAWLASYIYNQNLGGGYYDVKAGTIILYRKGEREKGRVQISHNVVASWYPNYINKTRGRSIRTLITEECPDLIDAGLIKPEYFEVAHKDEQHRREIKINSNGYAMVDGVRYYFGKKDDDKNKYLVQVNDTLALIYRKTERGDLPIETLDLVTLRPDQESKYPTLNRKETDALVSPVGLENYFPQRADESSDAYKVRLNELGSDILAGIDLSSDMIRAAGDSIYSLSFEEIIALASIIHKSNPDRSESKTLETKEKLALFASNFGRPGIRSLLVTEYDSVLAIKLLNGETGCDQEALRAIFHEFSEIQKNTDKLEMLTEYEGVLGQEIETLLRQTSESFRRRARDVLLNVEKDTEINPAETRLALRALSESLKCFLSIFREGEYGQRLKKNKEEIREQEAGFDFVIKDEKGADRYAFRLFIRPQENDNGQARINFSIKPLMEDDLLDAFTQEIRHSKGDGPKKSRDIRFGFDLDTEGGRQKARFSMDTGRSPYESEKYSRTGDVLGKLLATTSPSLSHNMGSFTEEYTDPDIFRRIASKFIEHLSALN